MRKTLVLASVLFGALLVPACAPRYDTRPMSVEAPRTMTVADTSAAEFEAAWWRQFDDPVLDGLIESAFSANRDLQAAASRYAAARELAGAAAQTPDGAKFLSWSRFPRFAAEPRDSGTHVRISDMRYADVRGRGWASVIVRVP